jgi:hypothetical protein
MFIERAASKRFPPATEKRNIIIWDIPSARHIALRWSAELGINSCVYKHSAPLEPACCFVMTSTSFCVLDDLFAPMAHYQLETTLRVNKLTKNMISTHQSGAKKRKQD